MAAYHSKIGLIFDSLGDFPSIPLCKDLRVIENVG